ncbi:hypothetical protein Mal48_07250 [Thalassoglobus polymorphus]|uniref:Uncharacterized protein n=1 Tax=Thalassoglobus polymorphus TaxID=2527994 RepID=A0A517QIM1_9PLAN|nr:hypothetical protein Mal48_07250 [Thalassoglobus polymorphus]
MKTKVDNRFSHEIILFKTMLNSYNAMSSLTQLAVSALKII